MAKIAVHGFINTDIIGQVAAFAKIDQETEMNSLQISPGGSAANVAVGLARLGEDVYFLGAVGGQLYTSFLLDSLEGVHRDYVQTIADAPSGMVMVLVNGDGLRTMYTYPGANAQYDVTQIPQRFIQDLDFLHMSSPRVPQARQLVQWKRQNPRLRVSFDPSSLLTKKGLACLEPLLSETDILFVNRSELHDLFPDQQIDQALQTLHGLGIQEIFVKRGRDGAVYSSLSDHSREVLSLPAQSVKAVDSTGSGDAFAVGVLYGFARGWSKEKILQGGITLGGRVVARMGARDGLPFAGEWGG
jgi:ribokinase